MGRAPGGKNMESAAIAAQERKANDDYAKAQALATKRSWFGGTGNKESAAELFKSAGVAYKVANQFDRAGGAFIESAKLHQVLGNKLDTLNCYVEAAQAYKQVNQKDAVKCFEGAAEMCMDANRLGAAAKHWREIGEIYEKEFEFEKAFKAFKQAGDFFKMDNQSSNANTCNLKVAAFSAQHLNDYDTAIKIFETVGKEAAQNNLLKYSAKKYFFHAGLCRLAAGKPVEDCKSQFMAYQDYDVTFSKQRECKFLLEACDAITAGDADDFTSKITAFDNISQLDSWTTSICLRIKKTIQAGDSVDLTGGDTDLGGYGGAPAAAGGGGGDDDDLC